MLRRHPVSHILAVSFNVAYRQVAACEIDSREVYAIPGEVEGRRCYKVGLADAPLKRKETHQTSRADKLKLELRCFYLNSARAEKYIKCSLTERGYHILGENFSAPHEVLVRLFREALARDQLVWDVVQSAYHRRRLNDLVPAEQVELSVGENSGAQYLLSSVVKFNGATTTLQAVLLDVLDKGGLSRGARLLEKAGLMFVPGADLVLLDKRPGSKLFDLFERGTGEIAWKSHLQGIAGFDKALNLLSVRQFLKSPWATPELLGVCVD